jgi:hypothetical protein
MYQVDAQRAGGRQLGAEFFNIFNHTQFDNPNPNSIPYQPALSNVSAASGSSTRRTVASQPLFIQTGDLTENPRDISAW